MVSKKSVVKKVAAKKSPVKKSAVKKSVAVKKVAAKKSPVKKSAQSQFPRKVTAEQMKYIIELAKNTNDLTKEDVKKLVRSARKCSRDSKCSGPKETKHTEKCMKSMLTLLSKLADGDFTGILNLVSTRTKEITDAMEQMAEMERRMKASNQIKDCVSSACFKEIAELSVAIRVFFEQKYGKDVDESMRKVSQIIMKLSEEFRSEHHVVLEKLRNGMREIVTNVMTTMRDPKVRASDRSHPAVMALKGLHTLIDSMSASEKTAIVSMYTKLGSTIYKEVPALFRIVREVVEIVKA